MPDTCRVSYLGGPTALIEVGGLRLLTDPTFNPAGSEYRTVAYTLLKSQGPALGLDAVGKIDAVLLSHDHHFDNLDDAGRQFLTQVSRVLSTQAAASRLGSGCEGLAPWESTKISREGNEIRITATPARHGPPHADRGPVIGFVIDVPDQAAGAIYVSGDTVWFEGVAEVAQRQRITLAILFMGAARVRAVGPWNLTFTAAEAVEAARAFHEAAILPLHYEGWAHFTEGRSEVQAAFDHAGLSERLCWLTPGISREFPL